MAQLSTVLTLQTYSVRRYHEC